MKARLTQLIFIIAVSLSSVFVMQQNIFAQEFQLYSDEDVFVETIPEIPGPNEAVRLQLKSYSFNLNNYYITWFENGEKKSGDFGNRNFNFTTGNSGSITDVTAVIEVNSQVFRKELRFVPSEVDLLWEAVDAYTPPFYQGKALPLSQAKIKVTAIPETQLIAPSDAPNLVYYWENNYQSISSASGFGKQSYTFTADPLNIDEKIGVTANDRRENSFAKNTIDIPVSSFEPNILFYEIDPNGRLLSQRALNNFGAIDGDLLEFSFHPLYMSTVEPNFVDLFVEWHVNDQATAPQDFARQNELFIGSDGASGTARIGVTLEGVQNLLQQAESFIDITFIN